MAKSLKVTYTLYLGSGLKRNGPIQIPSFVTRVPNGLEKGLFLAVDLGGTNCRICSVDLHGDSTYTLVQSKYAIPQDVRVNSSYKPLFNFIGQNIEKFLSDHPEANVTSASNGDGKTPASDNRRRLGFTFSFTYMNNSLSSGTMLQWDKGWDIPEALGKDPCKMLQNAIDELGLPVLVTALTNDSVGTLMARAYTSPWRSATLVGAIFGTGTNAAYIECLGNMDTSEPKPRSTGGGENGLMVINTEWGAWLDHDVTAQHTNPYDAQLDAASSNPKMQLLEKRVSGLYLGELARLTVLQLVQNKHLHMLLERDSPLVTQYGINASFLTLVAGGNDKSPYDLALRISKVLKVHNVSEDEALAIQLIAKAIVRRAARLSGAALAAIILQSGRLTNNKPITMANSNLTPARQAHSQNCLVPDLSKIVTRMKHVSRRIGLHLGLFHSKSKTAVPEIQKPMTEEDDIIDIGIDGLLFEAYPTFEKDLRGALQDVPQIGLEGERRIRIGLTKDGSGVGAALVAQST